jgi:uncharacterized protein YbbC (DUF1343 family)
MTVGELARWFNTDLGVGADLAVVPIQGWQRSQWLDETGLAWINPSPNLRSLDAAALYPGTVLVEGSSLSEGRGTDTPFEWIGAPWMDAFAWVQALQADATPGVAVQPAERTPVSGKFAGQVCQGVRISIVDRALLRPMELGVRLLAAARAVAPARVQFNPGQFDRLAGTDQVRLALEAGQPGASIAAAWQPAIDAFRATRERVLLY